MMDKYIKLENLGNGANSDVILVKNLQDKKLYALKRIFMEKEEKDNVKIKNEISILESLDHSNVIKYSESFEHNKKFCIVMEYADKGDLSHLVKKHKSSNSSIDEETLWNIFFQVSEAIKYIHSKKIIHRDIKSQNIFLTKIGLIKLGDFGISKTLENTTDFAKSFLGTPYFLSPEICAGSMYNYKSDVWMLGCVLYESSTLKKPFSGETFMNLMHNIMNKNYDPIPDYYSENFREVINSLLEKDPAKRPMISEILNSNNFIKEKYKIYLETKKKLEVLCKSDREQKINNSQIFNISDEITQVKILKGNYSTSTNKSFDFTENNKNNGSNNSTPIHNNIMTNTPKKIGLRKSGINEIQETVKHSNNFNNFIMNSEKKNERKSSMGNFHLNYNNKSVNKEFLDSEKPFIKESNNKLSVYINENNNNNISPINKKLVKKSHILEFEYTEETNNYMKLIVFLKQKIGQEKTNLLIKAVNFTNNDTIRFSLDNNHEQTRKILGSDYDQVVTLIRQIIMKCESNDVTEQEYVKKDEFIKKHKKTQSLGSLNFKQKI